MRLTHYFKWCIFWFVIASLLYCFFSDLHALKGVSTLTIEEKKSFWEILLNHSSNFLAYLILFPITILMVFYDIFVITLTTYIGIQTHGVKEAGALLLPHALIEFPNILFYSFLSFHMLVSFWRHPNLKTIGWNLYANRYYYLSSYLLLIAAAIIEGNLS